MADRNASVVVLGPAVEQWLIDMIALHDRLLDVLGRKYDAMRHANQDQMMIVAVEEQQILDALVTGERRRQALLDQAGPPPRSSDGSPDKWTVATLAAQLPDPDCGRLLALAEHLRQRHDQARSRMSVLWRVAETLAGHLHGVMQAIHLAVGKTGLYGPNGRPESSTFMPGTLDIAH